MFRNNAGDLLSRNSMEEDEEGLGARGYTEDSEYADEEDELSTSLLSVQKNLLQSEPGHAPIPNSGHARPVSFRKHKYVPKWLDKLDRMKLVLGGLASNIESLEALYDRRINRPAIHNSVGEEYEIERCSQEIGKQVVEVQQLVNQLQAFIGQSDTKLEILLLKNIVMAYAKELQKGTADFQHLQAEYEQKVRDRIKKKNKYLTEHSWLDTVSEINEVALNPIQQLTVVEAEQYVQELQYIHKRDQDLVKVQGSMRDLMEINKQMLALIADQGTVLDRVDFNLQKVSDDVGRSVIELKQAESDQKGYWQLKAMLLLSFFILLMLFLIFFT